MVQQQHIIPLLSPVGPGGDAEQVHREAGLAVVGSACCCGRAGEVEFFLRLELQRVVESAHHSNRESPEHLLQDLLREVQARPVPGGFLPDPNRPERPAQQQQQHEDPWRKHGGDVVCQKLKKCTCALLSSLIFLNMKI